MSDWHLGQNIVDFRREECEHVLGRHGDPIGVDETAILGDDPALALAGSDLDAWLAAHPCSCEGVCECDGDTQ